MNPDEQKECLFDFLSKTIDNIYILIKNNNESDKEEAMFQLGFLVGICQEKSRKLKQEKKG